TRGEQGRDGTREDAQLRGPKVPSGEAGRRGVVGEMELALELGRRASERFALANYDVERSLTATRHVLTQVTRQNVG
ncbi:MAG: hypothetical protein AB1762_05090, partial [Gemmatimonadota bacterium]